MAQFDLEMTGVTEVALGAMPVPAGTAGGRSVRQSFLAREIERVNATLATGVARHGGGGGWPQLARDYLAMMESERSGNVLLLMLVFLIAAVGISNTMLIAAYERIREFGMMRALGMDDGAVRATMVFEAGFIGCLGSLCGVLLGAVAVFFLVDQGIDMSRFYGDVSIGYRVTAVFRGRLESGHDGGRDGVWNTLASMAIALLPARRALRLGVVQCLGHE